LLTQKCGTEQLKSAAIRLQDARHIPAIIASVLDKKLLFSIFLPTEEQRRVGRSETELM
jgi:hypothetical protein